MSAINLGVMKRDEEGQRLMRVAEVQQRLIERYCKHITAEEGIKDDQERADYELRSQFSRDVTYLVHLVYREAQGPLIKQLTEFVMSQQRPILMDGKL